MSSAETDAGAKPVATTEGAAATPSPVAVAGAAVSTNAADTNAAEPPSPRRLIPGDGHHPAPAAGGCRRRGE